MAVREQHLCSKIGVGRGAVPEGPGARGGVGFVRFAAFRVQCRCFQVATFEGEGAAFFAAAIAVAKHVLSSVSVMFSWAHVIHSLVPAFMHFVRDACGH